MTILSSKYVTLKKKIILLGAFKEVLRTKQVN